MGDTPSGAVEYAWSNVGVRRRATQQEALDAAVHLVLESDT